MCPQSSPPETVAARLEDILAASAARYRAKTALIAGDIRLSFAELDAASQALAARLLDLGIAPGDRVALVLDNGAEPVIALFAIWKAKAVACPLHASVKPQKLAAILDSIEPAVLITGQRHRLKADEALEQASRVRPALLVLDEQGPASAQLRRQAVPAGHPATDSTDESEPLALIIHTSGSTGMPKGVMLSHANVIAACRSIASYLGNDENDIVLNVLPLSFGYGITQIVTMVMTGGTLVVEKSFAFPRAILQRLKEEKVTGLPLVPSMAALIAGIGDLEPGSLPDLRYITNAAAAMPPSLGERLRALFPQAGLFLMYGQSECLRSCYLPPEEAAHRPLSVGRAIPGTRAFVAGPDGKPAAPGTIGELVVEGPHVMLGYWRDEAASRQKLLPAASGRGLRSGDLFREDAEGYLYFVSRSDDIIKTRGEKVSPQEVENVLYALAGIREAAVGGIEDAMLGQAIRAYVVLDEGAMLGERDIIRHCAQYLEDYMVPKSVEFRDSLPRTATGKIRLGAETDNPIEQGQMA